VVRICQDWELIKTLKTSLIQIIFAIFPAPLIGADPSKKAIGKSGLRWSNFSSTWAASGSIANRPKAEALRSGSPKSCREFNHRDGDFNDSLLDKEEK
jgi:hypothetical protein